MRIAEGLEVLEIVGGPNTIYPVLLWDDITTILVDTGYPGQLPLVKEAMERAGKSFESLDTIIITHQDVDHIGNLAATVKKSGGKVKVVSHSDEKPYIQGDKTPIKLAKYEAALSTMTEEQQAFYHRFKSGFQMSQSPVDQTLNDGQELPCCGGIVVVHTPGHTPGHICLYHKASKTLITGDAFTVNNGELTKSPAQYMDDPALAARSLGKLAEYEIRNVVSYHGGFFSGNANEQIAKLAIE